MEVSSITCPLCQMVSYHPEDIDNKYCGNCRSYWGDRLAIADLLIAVGHYKLVDGEAVLCKDTNDYLDWIKSAADSEYIVDVTEIGEVEISTVFLRINSHFKNDRISQMPKLWETMIFGGVHDCKQWKYNSKAEAIKGHELAVEFVKSTIPEQ